MEKPKITFKPQNSPIFAGLSDYVKDPANFEKIQLSILHTFQSTCGHSDVLEWAKCKECTEKMHERRKLLKKYGFKNAKQYLSWKKVHEEIKTRYPLVDWKANKSFPLLA